MPSCDQSYPAQCWTLHVSRDVQAFLDLSCDAGVWSDMVGTWRVPTTSPKPPLGSTWAGQASWARAGVWIWPWAPAMALIRSDIEKKWAEHGFTDRFLVGSRLMGVLMAKCGIPACRNSNKRVYGPSLIYSWWLKSLFPQICISQRTQGIY